MKDIALKAVKRAANNRVKTVGAIVLIAGAVGVVIDPKIADAFGAALTLVSIFS